MSSNIPHSFIYFNDSENIIFAYAVSFSLFRIFICICIHLPTCLALWCVIFTSPFVSLLALYSQHLYFVSSSKILSIQRYIWIDFFRFVAAFCLLCIVCGVYANFSQWPHYFYPMQYTCMHLSSFFFLLFFHLSIRAPLATSFEFRALSCYLSFENRINFLAPNFYKLFYDAQQSARVVRSFNLNSCLPFE